MALASLYLWLRTQVGLSNLLMCLGKRSERWREEGECQIESRQSFWGKMLTAVSSLKPEKVENFITNVHITGEHFLKYFHSGPPPNTKESFAFKQFFIISSLSEIKIYKC